MKYWPDGELIRFYRRDGTPYPQGNDGVLEWENDMTDLDAKVVKQEVLPNGYQVSTIWLGLDHSSPWEEPLIFETMVFDRADKPVNGSMRRYFNEHDAIAGHIETVDDYVKRQV